MSYATRQDMIDRFGEEELILLTDRDGSAGMIVDAVLDLALADGAATINGYIGGRYKLPLATVPEVLVRLNCDIARYQLYDERAPEQLQKRHEADIDFLTALGSGKLSLGVSDAGETEPSNNVATIESAGSVFSRKNSKGFM